MITRTQTLWLGLLAGAIAGYALGAYDPDRFKVVAVNNWVVKLDSRTGKAWSSAVANPFWTPIEHYLPESNTLSDISRISR